MTDIDAIVEAFQDNPTLYNFIQLLELQDAAHMQMPVAAIFNDQSDYDILGIHVEASTVWIEIYPR